MICDIIFPHCPFHYTATPFWLNSKSKLSVHKQIMSWEIAKQDVHAIGNNEGNVLLMCKTYLPKGV